MCAITRKSARGIAVGGLVTGIIISYALVSDVLKPTGATSRAAPDAPTEARLATAYGKLPLHFEVNRGQTDTHVEFLSRGRGYTLFLAATEAVLVLRKAAAPNTRHSLEEAPRTTALAETEARPPTVLRIKNLRGRESFIKWQVVKW